MTVKEHVHRTYTYTCDLCQQQVDKSTDLQPLLLKGEVGVCASCMGKPLRDVVATLGLESPGIPRVSPPSQDNGQRDPAGPVLDGDPPSPTRRPMQRHRHA